MSWFCNSPEAVAQMKICEENECPGCNKCIWIEESGYAMSEHATVINPKPATEISPNQSVKYTESFKSNESDHPLLGYITEKFGGQVD